MTDEGLGFIAPGSRSERLQNIASVKETLSHIQVFAPFGDAVASEKWDWFDVFNMQYRRIVLTRHKMAAPAPCVWTNEELFYEYPPVYGWHVWVDDPEIPTHWWASEATLRKWDDNG